MKWVRKIIFSEDSLSKKIHMRGYKHAKGEGSGDYKKKMLEGRSAVVENKRLPDGCNVVI